MGEEKRSLRTQKSAIHDKVLTFEEKRIEKKLFSSLYRTVEKK